jgi:hypothetical protein
MQTATQEFGTGTATVMTQVAADGSASTWRACGSSSATLTCPTPARRSARTAP